MQRPLCTLCQARHYSYEPHVFSKDTAHTPARTVTKPVTTNTVTKRDTVTQNQTVTEKAVTKRGRPRRLEQQALSAADRAKRYRERLKAARQVTH